ncbi:MAG: FHA domain-containing protein [Desulfuromonadales bacterium]|nr:FHA domain-containing protein [Desulfuromonadales bacterium]
MINPNRETDGSVIPPTPLAVVAKVIRGRAAVSEKRFTSGFVIGRTSECDLQVSESCVSRHHVRVDLINGQCSIKDLGSANGTFLNGERIQEAQLPDCVEIELGKGGALVSLWVERAELPKITETAPEPKEFDTETQIIRHYFENKSEENIGEQTMMFRRAFQRVHKKKSRKYQVVIGVVILLLMAAGSVIFYQTQKLNKLRATAESIFYTTKSLELQISKLEQIILMNADPKQVAELKEKRLKLRDMEKEYDNFVKELGIYKKAPEDEQLILRVARIFGECDASAPKGFVDEVRRYIQIWKKTDRLKTALSRGKQKGYQQLIARVLNDNNLPPQYLFLALQESNFDERAVGPQTSYGFAKGMWQFISSTGNQYGLQIGPLYGQAVYDPLDDRFDFVKSTVAATKYIKDLSATDAQASGLLVMASYNWGQNNIRQIIRRMPENPRERNFWRLLAYKDIPRETYDYVFSIVSAAVICEDPHYFGVDVECPVLKTQQKQEKTGK